MSMTSILYEVTLDYLGASAVAERRCGSSDFKARRVHATPRAGLNIGEGRARDLLAESAVTR